MKTRKKVRLSFIIVVSLLLLLTFFYLFRELSPTSFSVVDSNVAVVNGEVISLDDFNNAYNHIPESLRANVNKSDLLNQMINEKLLLQEAKLNNLSVSSNELDERINLTLELNNLTQDDFFSSLEQKDISKNDFRNYLLKELLINKLIDFKFNNITVTDDEMLDYYNNSDAFKNLTFNQSKSKINSILYSKKKTELINELIDSLNDEGDIIIKVNQSSNAEHFCIDNYNITRGKTIYYTLNGCKYCDSMSKLVNELNENGYNILVYSYSDDLDLSLLSDCLNVDLDKVPQIVCSSNNKKRIGNITKKEIINFVNSCSNLS